MAKIKSDYFLLNGNSFFTETEGGTATVVRSGVGKKLTQTEKDVAGDHYNSTKDTIDFAQIYDLDFGPHYISKLGASDTWMSQTRLKEYKNAFKKATGESGPNISFAQAVEAGKLWNPTPLNENANGKSTSTTDFNGSVLRYPLLNTGRYDYLSIASYKNEPDRFDTNTSFTSMRTVEERMTGSALGRVFLPMQPGIAEQTQVQWSQDTMNALEAAGANISGGTIKGAASGSKEAAQAFMKNTGGAAKGLAGSINEDDVAAYFAGQAIGKNILTRTTGKALNPNLELLFQGPTLRTFNYTYKFTPRDGKESAMVKKIIRFFKKSMVPKRGKNKIFLETPNIFKLKYIFKSGGQHPFLNKIKMCALQSFDVQYTPDGSYMTYEDGSMTSYQVSMSFGELNPIYQEDYDTDTRSMGY